ncbi:MAG: hypothetical protein ACREVE_10750 [Gammaproteobacteria bacterium]
MFKKLVIAVMLLTAPFAQAKIVLACAMMDSHVTERCCCDHKRHNAAAPEDALSGDRCCAVAIEPTKDIGLAAASESAAKKPVDKLWDSSPDVSTAPPGLLPATELSSTSQVSLLPEPRLLDGSALYLLTARLRL